MSLLWLFSSSQALHFIEDGKLLARIPFRQLHMGPSVTPAVNTAGKDPKDEPSATLLAPTPRVGAGKGAASPWCTRFPAVFSLPQTSTEEILARELQKQWGVSVEFGTELLGLEKVGGSSHLTLSFEWRTNA